MTFVNSASRVYSQYRTEIQRERASYLDYENPIKFLAFYDSTKLPTGELVRDWGGLTQNKYIFEARTECIDITGYQGEFSGAITTTPEQFDVKFFIPIDSYGMYRIFKYFGHTCVTDGRDEFLSRKKCYICDDVTTTFHMKNELMRYAKAYFNILHIHKECTSRKENDFLYSYLGGIKIGNSYMKNWNQFIDNFGTIIYNHFGNPILNKNNSVITKTSVGNVLTSHRIHHLFPLTHNQLGADAHAWKVKYWRNRTGIPFGKDESKYISVSFPFRFNAIPSYENQGVSASFKATIEFHYVDGYRPFCKDALLFYKSIEDKESEESYRKYVNVL